uniref:Olfactory receptor 76 n=1 Tax=Aulacocentrum confusum TaxID=2767324 RepID=A0A7G8Z995_9HYME|nr:olfactory receptor 76 [Aulacocentrum confusum]
MMIFIKPSRRKKIRIHYYLIGLSFNRILLRCVSISAIAWYSTPFVNFIIISRLRNETVMLTTPFRLPAFADTTSFDRTVIFYIYEIGLNYFSVCYVSTCSVVSVAVNNICCQLAVLSYRIKQLKSNYNFHSNEIFHDFCVNHLNTIRLVKTIDNAFHLVFLNELIMITVLISLIMYNMILHFDDVDIVSVVSLAGYGFVMISLIGLNCFISQNLIDQSAELRDAYWKCEWYNMPISCKRALMISMIYSQIPLQLTAGKFYIYSMPNFLNILKSSMAYVSMLRTVNDK